VLKNPGFSYFQCPSDELGLAVEIAVINGYLNILLGLISGGFFITECVITLTNS
jgi:hypothetical protein